LYNPAAAAAAQGWTLVRVGAQELAPFCHNSLQQAALALPGQDVLIVRSAIRPQQVLTQRPSYVNSLLIQRAGTLVPGGCNQCQLPRPGLRPYPECRILYGHFSDSCGNCKWRDHSARCAHNPGGDDGSDDRSDSSDNDSSDSSRTLTDGGLHPPPGRSSIQVVIPVH
jgi:hypothetical protein